MNTTDTNTILVRRDGRIGRITLNRPRALNALDLPMIRTMTTALADWQDDPAIHGVVVDGADGKAFCAGGDIRDVRQDSLDGRHDRIEAFFAEEYALNRLIAEYRKPYIALVDGFCLGGGIGISVHGTCRIASEYAAFAMPETAIALFPDVGATFLLPRLPGAIGMWMALTGARLSGADAVQAGLATHYVPRARFAALSAALAADGPGALGRFTEAAPDGDLARHRAEIDTCFGADSVSEIVSRLQADDSAWAQEQLQILRTMSPSSVLWSFAIVRAGATRTLAQCLDAELRLTRQVTRHPDFIEGVRAMLVDKDRAPRWLPARLEDVDPAAIAAMLTA